MKTVFKAVRRVGHQSHAVEYSSRHDLIPDLFAIASSNAVLEICSKASSLPKPPSDRLALQPFR